MRLSVSRGPVLGRIGVFGELLEGEQRGGLAKFIQQAIQGGVELVRRLVGA